MKKLLSILLICTIFHATCGQIFAECCNNIKIEHLDVHKNAPCNIVKIIDSKRTVEKGNVLEIAFDEKFMSKCHHAGDVVHFITRDALYTCEGTLILPANTKILAEVTKIEKPIAKGLVKTGEFQDRIFTKRSKKGGYDLFEDISNRNRSKKSD